MKRYWSQSGPKASFVFPKRRDTTYGLSYSYWSPKDYVGGQCSRGYRHPLLACQAPSVQCCSGPVDSKAVSKSRCSYSKTISLRPDAASSPARSQFKCIQSASNSVKDQADLPEIAALWVASMVYFRARVRHFLISWLPTPPIKTFDAHCCHMEHPVPENG